jgi:hypothetical protein
MVMAPVSRLRKSHCKIWRTPFLIEMSVEAKSPKGRISQLAQLTRWEAPLGDQETFGHPTMIRILAIFSALAMLLPGPLALVTPASAAIDPVASSMHEGRASGDLDQWQRIDFRSSGLPRRKAAQMKVAIQTKGPSMQGLIRIPGAPASNFDTGKGLTVVELINIGNDSSGYADIVALEILFTQTISGQFYEVFAVDDGDRAK